MNLEVISDACRNLIAFEESLKLLLKNCEEISFEDQKFIEKEVHKATLILLKMISLLIQKIFPLLVESTMVVQTTSVDQYLETPSFDSISTIEDFKSHLAKNIAKLSVNSPGRTELLAYLENPFIPHNLSSEALEKLYADT